MDPDESKVTKVEDVMNLVQEYKFAVIDTKSSNEEKLVLRLPFLSMKEIGNFRRNLTDSISVCWIRRTSSKTARYHRRLWCCHLSKHKKSNSSKQNANCTAKLEVRIKNMDPLTVFTDIFLEQNPPLRTVIIISLKHSHIIKPPAPWMGILPEIKHQFFSYFECGMSLREVTFLYENELNTLQSSKLSKTSKKEICRLHKRWRKERLTKNYDHFVKLKEKIEDYNKQGTSVKLLEGDSWAIAVVTNVMKRTQHLSLSKGLIYVDSSYSSRDLYGRDTSYTVTVMLTASKVGALPLAVLIHKNQTTENYVNAFKLLKENFKEFFGEKNDLIFMMNDSSAKMNAAKEIWPQSIQLLCHFYVEIAEWRWFFAQQIIKIDERIRLMKLFQDAMYADTEEALMCAASAICKETQYPQFVERFKTFCERKVLWVSLYRHDLLTKIGDTNRYAEATIRILKEVVLNKTNVYSKIGFFHFIDKFFDQYLVEKLNQLTDAENSEPYILYSSLIPRTEDYGIETVIQVETDLFLIPTHKNYNQSHVVYVNVGGCTCYNGQIGSFCTHQYFLLEHQKISFPDMLPIDSEERDILGKVALGNEESLFNSQSAEESCMLVDSQNSLVNLETTAKINSAQSTSEGASHEENQTLVDEFARVSNLIRQDMPPEISLHLKHILKNIKCKEDFLKLHFL